MKQLEEDTWRIIGELRNGKVFALLEAKLFYLVCLKNIYIVLQGWTIISALLPNMIYTL